MTPKEFNRLLSFHRAKRYAPRTNAISKRSAKAKGTGTGQWVRGSRIVSEVPLEKLFLTRK
jgi:hypothetical protein